VPVDRLKKMFRISQLLGFSRKDTFADISGHDDVKWAFERTLSSPDPIHILLKGLVGTGKTRFIKAIEKRYPDLSCADEGNWKGGLV
jgi:Mg-chelatase subunit ChlI